MNDWSLPGGKRGKSRPLEICGNGGIGRAREGTSIEPIPSIRRVRSCGASGKGWGNMNERELVRRLGLPDEIVGPEDRLLSTAWICFSCGETTTSHKPIPCPAPCSRCRGIMFETWRLPYPAILRVS